ncbi:hypothetical protein PATSB16_29120 [Pandoraea thiooxydans]|nr:hypothetical protein PATSB16_29120 [Pandoraea thiooxydans]
MAIRSAQFQPGDLSRRRVDIQAEGLEEPVSVGQGRYVQCKMVNGMYRRGRLKA